MPQSREAPPLKSHGRALLQWTMLLGTVAVIAWLVFLRREELVRVRDIPAATLARIAVVILLSYLVNAVTFRAVTSRFGVTLPLRQATLIQLAGYTLNYLPMKSGTVMQGAIMKVRYGIHLSDFAALAAGAQVGAMWTATTVGGVFMLALDASSAVAWALAVVPTALLAAAYAWDRHAQRRPHDELSRPARTVMRAVEGLLRLIGDLPLMAWLVLLNLVVLGLQAVRYYLVFQAIGGRVSLYEAVVLAAIGWVAHTFSFIPGGLGFREGGVAGAAAVIGLAASTALDAALVDRALDIAAVLVVGVPSAVYLSRLARVPVIAPDSVDVP